MHLPRKSLTALATSAPRPGQSGSTPSALLPLKAPIHLPANGCHHSIRTLRSRTNASFSAAPCASPRARQIGQRGGVLAPDLGGVVARKLCLSAEASALPTGTLATAP